MKIKNLILLLLVSVFFINCSKNKIVVRDNEIKDDMFYLDGEVSPFSGICIVPYEDGKTVKEVRKFKNGVVHGEALSYFPDGKLKRKGTYVKGKMDGTWWQYFDNGSVEFEISYSNDSVNGCYKEWYSNGKMKEEGAFIKNHRTGKWKLYNPDGSLSENRNYTALSGTINQSNQNQCI